MLLSEMMMTNGLSAAEESRYARHLSIPEVGVDGQLRLKQASVLMIGTGGLGSPAAMYLAAAGVGRIGLVDPDVVELSNLQRQILHGGSWVGQSKLASAVARLAEVNPEVKVEPHAVRFTAENALEIAAGYDVILDGCDNFPTRFLSNDTAYFLHKPLVYGAIQRFEGQIGVFAPHLGGPCYRCLLPDLPAAGAVPSCAEAGVLGVLPGIIGSLQAMEAIKLLLEIGEVPLGRLTIYDALRSSFRSLRLRRDPACRLCGETPVILSVRNQETTAAPDCTAFGGMDSITVGELRVLLAGDFQGVLLDVREPQEHAMARIEGARLVPLATLIENLDSLPKDQEILVHCKAGGRSARAVLTLLEHGFTRVKNVSGGMDAWLADET